MKQTLRILFGTTFLMGLPCLAWADMMQRTTQGDILFFLLKILLGILVAVAFLVWIILLLVERKTTYHVQAGHITFALIGALGLSIVLGEVYYQTLGYGAHKNAVAKARQARSMLRNIPFVCETYYADTGEYPTNTAMLIDALKETGSYLYDEYVQHGALIDSWGSPIEITFGDDTLSIHSAGPDRKFNTVDDLIYPDG